MDAKEVYVNLKNYNFEVMNYPLGAVEAEICKEALKKQIQEYDKRSEKNQ